MKLLRETVDIKTELEVLVEETGEGCKKNKNYRIKGTFLEANITNRNRRLYSLPILSKAVGVYNDEYIKTNRSLSELGHSDRPELDFSRVSHIIESLYMDGNKGIGCARILEDLPFGKIAATLLKNGVSLSVSTKGVGSIDNTQSEADKQVVGSDFILLGVDIVMNPSCPSAVVEGVLESVLYDSKEWILEGDKFVEKKITNLKTKVDKKYSSKLALNYMLEFMEDIKRNSK